MLRSFDVSHGKLPVFDESGVEQIKNDLLDLNKDTARALIKTLPDHTRKTLMKVLEFSEKGGNADSFFNDKDLGGIDINQKEFESLTDALYTKYTKYEDIPQSHSNIFQKIIKGIENIFGRTSSESVLNELEKVKTKEFTNEIKGLKRQINEAQANLSSASGFDSDRLHRIIREAQDKIDNLELKRKMLTGYFD